MARDQGGRRKARYRAALCALLPAQTNWTARLAVAGEARADALLVFPDVLTMVHRAKIAEFAIAHRLPSMFGWGEYCDAGGLLSYGANQRATYFWLATYADRILRGEKPANLPVFQPTKFELVVNLRTAERLGIDLDKSSVLFRANRVIE